MAGQKTEDFQTYYVPEQSSMAILSSICLALIVLGVAGGINSLSTEASGTGAWLMFAIGLVLFIGVLSVWFGIAIKENMQGMNSEQLKRSYRIGMQWFIFSEVMFFACFFGALLYFRTVSGPELGSEVNSILWNGFNYDWPLMITPQDAVGGVDMQSKLGHLANNGEFKGADKDLTFWSADKWYMWLPLWNTILLVLSSVWCEFAHHALKENNRKKFNFWLGLTLLFGFVFVGLQALEYYEAYAHYGLTLETGAYGSIFFMITGFHGFHVCLGAIMLLVQWLRSTGKGHFSAEDHFGFEASAWYWHFVDVVWIFVMIVVYLY
jgi:cytochrome c oxidase subunit 3